MTHQLGCMIDEFEKGNKLHFNLIIVHLVPSQNQHKSHKPPMPSSVSPTRHPQTLTVLEFKDLLSTSIDDAGVLEVFRPAALTNFTSRVIEALYAVAEMRSASLALDCLNVAFPDSNALEDSAKQDLVLVKLAIAVGDSSPSEEQRLRCTKSVLESEDLNKWNSSNYKTLKEFILIQSECCSKCRSFAAALEWLDICKEKYRGDEATEHELGIRITQCHLAMGDLDRAEVEIMNVPSNMHRCLLQIQLSIKREPLSDTIALIKQATTMDGVKAVHFLSLLEARSENVKLHILMAALFVDPGNLFASTSLLLLVTATTKLSPNNKVNIVLKYAAQCKDDTLVRRITWNTGHLAFENGMRAEAANLFGVCFTRASEDNKEKRLDVYFLHCQSIYRNPQHVYTESDLHALEEFRKLSNEIQSPSKSRPAKDAEEKEKRRQLPWVFTLKAWISMNKMENLLEAVQRAPCGEMSILLLTSFASIPIDIHFQCLQKLVNSITEKDIDCFAWLFHIVVDSILQVDPEFEFKYLNLGSELVKSRIYPRAESVWLCGLCVNNAFLYLSLKHNDKAKSWFNLASSYFFYLHDEDKKVYESQLGGLRDILFLGKAQ